MRTLYTMLIAVGTLTVITADSSTAQTRTSIANGLFYFPTTWDCFCVPSPHTGESIVINHAVTLNNAIGVYGGSLTINGSGSLIQDATPRDMHVNSAGEVTVHGTLTIDRLWVQNGSFENQGTSTIRTFANEMTLNNSGTINVPDSLYNSPTAFLTNGTPGTINVSTFYTEGTFNNYGQVLGVDSMTNSGTFTNHLSGTVMADSATNTGSFNNNGQFNVIALTNTGGWTNTGSLGFADLLNFGSFMNNGSMQGAGSLGNLGDFINNGTGTIAVDVSFFNADQIPPQPGGTTAMFGNSGTVTVGDSWYNFAIVHGSAPGSFTVQDSTVNYGILIGTFDLCDLTPTVVTPPIIDFDFGTVDAGITYCDLVTDAHLPTMDTFTMFPNPATDLLTVTFPAVRTDVVLSLLDMTGRRMLEQRITSTDRHTLDVSSLSPGMYLLRIRHADSAGGHVSPIVVR